MKRNKARKRRCSLASTATLGPASLSVQDNQLASSIAGIVQRLTLYPIDTLKTRVQHVRYLDRSRSVHDYLFDFINKEGARGLYKGIFGSLLATLPHSLVYMPTYEFAQVKLQNMGERTRTMISGAIAGFFASFVRVPVDVIKKRIQAGMDSNVGGALRSICAEKGKPGVFGGISKFYAGWRSGVFYDVPYGAVQFAVLRTAQRVVQRITKRTALNDTDNVIIGALTGAITSLITEPLDVVRTRLMTQRALNMSGLQISGRTIYRGWLNCLQTIAKEEGMFALWKGSNLRLIWIGVGSALWYSTYEAAKRNIAYRKRDLSFRLENNNKQRADTKLTLSVTQ